MNLKKISTHRRTISVLLTVCMLIACLPLNALSAGEPPAVSDAATVNTMSDVASDVESDMSNDSISSDDLLPVTGFHPAVTEAEVLDNGYTARLKHEEPNLNTLIFARADGSKVMRVFDFPVKYVDGSGVVRDKSLALSHKAEIGYFTADTDVVSVFPKMLSEGIRLTYKSNEIDIRLIPVLSNEEEYRQSAAQSRSNTEPALLSAAAMPANEGKSVAYLYNEHTVLEYTPTYDGFKEDIVVSEYTGQTEYAFRLLTNGLGLIQTGMSYRLVNSQGETKAYIGDVIIFTADERNNAFGSMTVQTVEANEEYIITIHVDADYLEDERTAYPIRIDPTISVNYGTSGSGAIEDVTLNSLSGSDGDSWSLTVGKRATYGISRILMRFPGLDLSDIDTASQITGASVELRDLMCEDAALTVYAHTFTGNVWSESTANWSNVGSENYSSSALSSRTISYANGTSSSARGTSQPHRYAFDITSAVRGWKNGTYSATRGILFKASSSIENGSSYISKTICSYNRSSEYRPSLTVTYNPLPSTTPTISISGSSKINEGQAATMIATTNPTEMQINWSVNYTNIPEEDRGSATVNPYGRVTALKAGQVNVQASFTIASTGMTYTAQKQIYITIADGVYWVKNKHSGKYLHVKNGEINNYTNVYQYTKNTSTPYNLRQLWKIKYLGNGCYSIRPMHKLDMGLDVTNNNVDIYPINTTDTLDGVPSYACWAISSNASGYIFQKNNFKSQTLSLETDSTALSININVQNYVGKTSQLWTLEKLDPVPSGFLLYDTATGKLLSSAPTRYMAINTTKHLRDSLKLTVAVYSGTIIDQSVTLTPASNSHLSINSTQHIIARKVGLITITVTKNGISGNAYFNIRVTDLDATYSMRNRYTGRYVDIDGPSYNVGAIIHQWDLHESNQCRWILTQQYDGYYTIRSVYSGLYIGIENNSTSSGAAVKQYSYSDDAKGIFWKIISTSENAVKLVPKSNSSMALSVHSDGNANGTDLVQYMYSGDSNYNDEWILERWLPTSGQEIAYEPAVWNETSLKSQTNCYAYALNFKGAINPQYTIQPGSFANYTYLQSEISSEKIIQAVSCDSSAINFIFEEIDPYEVCESGYKVALVIDNGEDYHWYRQNPNGTWSHKRGRAEVTNIDASGKIILDPSLANRNYGTLNYDIFAGFFRVTPVDASSYMSLTENAVLIEQTNCFRSYMPYEQLQISDAA